MATIAIIDDDPDILESLETVLKSEGYGVISAKNITDGDKLVKNNNPDLVILDVMMEEEDDGFFLAQKFRKENFKNPIIMLTSISKTLGFTYDKNELIPVEKFLEKPISPQKLIDEVKNLLESGR